MRRRTLQRVALLGALTPALLLAIGVAPAAAAAAGGHLAVPDASVWGTLTSPITSVFSAIGSAVFGAFSWTVGLATKFILVTLAAFVRMLIPRSWAKDAIQVFDWIVAIPDYAGTITSPSGSQVYGFAGVNDLRQLFQWLGIGLLPLTLVYSTSRAMLGRGDHVAAPLARVVTLAGLLLFYPYLWEQGAALTNQLTSIILSPAPVVSGIHDLMAYATEGVALGGWQLIDLGLMAALALELLALIFVKVVIILLGALLFATGPLMIGLVATESGDAIARAWLSAVGTFLALPVAWAAVFAVGAVLVGDAGTAGPLIGGNSQIGSLLGGVIVAVAGAATLWLCLKAAREVGGLLRLQLGGLLVIAGRARARSSSAPAGASSTGGSQRAAAAASSIRSFQGKVRTAGAAALDAAGPRTAAVASAVGSTGRRGLIVSGATGAGTAAIAGTRLAGRSAAGSAARSRVATAASAATLATETGGSRTGRAGAVASRMARAGTAAWQQQDARGSGRSGAGARTGRRAARPSTGGTGGPSGPRSDGQRDTTRAARGSGRADQANGGAKADASQPRSARSGERQAPPSVSSARGGPGSGRRENAQRRPERTGTRTERHADQAAQHTPPPVRPAPRSAPPAQTSQPGVPRARVSTPPTTHRTQPNRDRQPEPERPRPRTRPTDQTPNGRD
jgi:hypothetical protein